MENSVENSENSGTGSCEKIDFSDLARIQSSKSLLRIPYKQRLRCWDTFEVTGKIRKTDFFTASSPQVFTRSSNSVGSSCHKTIQSPGLASTQSMKRLQRAKGIILLLLTNHYFPAPLARILNNGMLDLGEYDRWLEMPSLKTTE